MHIYIYIYIYSQIYIYIHIYVSASLVAQMIKNMPTSSGDTKDVNLIPGSGRCPREGNDNPL